MSKVTALESVEITTEVPATIGHKFSTSTPRDVATLKAFIGFTLGKSEKDIPLVTSTNSDFRFGVEKLVHGLATEAIGITRNSKKPLLLTPGDVRKVADDEWVKLSKRLNP